MEDNQSTKILESIKTLAGSNSGLHIRDLLDGKRLDEFHVKTDYLSYDYSKQRITKEVLDELLIIPEKINLKKSILDISNGEFLNPTEDRNVSHMLYRDLSSSKNSHELKEIFYQRKKLSNFIKTIQGAPESYIDTIISISIGGSRLGPELLSEVYGNPYSKIKVYYCSSYDFIELENVMSARNPARTLVVISSKSFNTPEVIENANKAKDWLESLVGDHCWDQIIGISSNKEAMTEFGIKDTNQFEILDSVGGRYSIWSSISLPAIVDMGWKSFEEFLEGAYEADKHFRNNSWDQNIPVLMALFSVWNLNGLSINNLGIFSYDFKIRSLTKYLAQMGMESNGKTYNSDNKKTEFYTCPLIWGGYGPDAQHSVFQWLLQGTDYSACDFIGVKDEKGVSDSYQMLLAQITALSVGESNEELNYKSVEGNNPISLIQLNDLTPKSIGYLLATYEHKTFVESRVYDINPFDQWGVQLGKKLTIRSSEEKDFMRKYFYKEFLC
jgi:glucose-6-phosphate isomerase